MIKVINSERLSYRLMNEEDAQLLFELDQDPAVMKYINGGKMTTMKEVEDVMLPRMASYTDPEKGWGLWAVFTLGENEFIGWVLVRPMDFFSSERNDQDIELGWRFKQSSWGKGYATEAAKSVLDALQKSAQYLQFTALALPENTASINIMKKLGMQFIKTDLHEDPLGDMEVDYYQLNKLSS